MDLLDPLACVTDILRPISRSRRLPAQDRYYLSHEAEAGDPLCFEDPADATTDSDSLPDGWDDDDEEDFDPDEEAEDIEMVQRDHHMS